MPLQILMPWPTTLFAKTLSFPPYSEAPAAERYESTIEAATSWEDIPTNFVTPFSDGRNKFRCRLEVEHCVPRDREESRNFLHRIKNTVDKGWPDDMNGIARAHQNAERDAQARERRQRYMDYSVRGLRPRNLQRKAQEYLMEHPMPLGMTSQPHITEQMCLFKCHKTF